MTDVKHEKVKTWTRGVPVEAEALEQVKRVADMPFVYPHVAVMPDVHVGIGATVGSVVPTRKAVIPAAVGVDIGCGMMAVQTSLAASDLPESLKELRHAIESAVPHGRTRHGGTGDRGAWHHIPKPIEQAWRELRPDYEAISEKHPQLGRGNDVNHLGTLGTGNHFIEVCLDEGQNVWVMLHSGSRGVGNRIGSYFIRLAKEDMRVHEINLPDQDLAYLEEGTEHFDDYVQAVEWAQTYARRNRELMMEAVLGAMRKTQGIPSFRADLMAVNCHHNYVRRERHAGEDLLVTRKGAISAREGELGIIPGSMGAQSYIVRGKGNPDSLHSSSHGAGRVMSRTAARKHFTLEEHLKAIEGVESRQDADVIDETPGAYKSIDAVMQAQQDLVEVVHTLRQILVVKG